MLLPKPRPAAERPSSNRTAEAAYISWPHWQWRLEGREVAPRARLRAPTCQVHPRREEDGRGQTTVDRPALERVR
jgi:hypothetical protein